MNLRDDDFHDDLYDDLHGWYDHEQMSPYRYMEKNQCNQKVVLEKG